MNALIGFMAHGNCYLWDGRLTGLHVSSDAIIALSYIAIAFTMSVFLYKWMRDNRHLPILIAIGAFILLCGFTHLVAIWTVWVPNYWASGFLKLITALVSFYTAVVLDSYLPGVVAEWTQMRQGNNVLKEQLKALQEELVVKNKRIEDLSESRSSLKLEIEGVTKDLERAKSDLAQFVYTIAHDLKSPTITISNFVSILEETLNGYKFKEDSQVEIAESMAFIKQSCENSLSLITDLLEWSRVGDDENKIVATDSNKILDKVISSLRSEIDAKNVLISRTQLPIVLANPVHLAQVFQNLISNAIKFSAPGMEPYVAITAEDKGEFFEFAIADRGLGFEQSNAIKIFAPFQRLVRKEVPGTGIGLAIVKKIINLHGGHIRAESEIGKGSTFFFTLKKGEL